MGRLSPLWRLASNWYVSGLLLGALGIILGSMVFFFAWPGKPKIGIIDIPFTVINDRSAFEIGALIDYARDQDSIKGVVISINSPGGGAAPSEHLYLELARLREKKPVVMVMHDIVASGGYMMALGTNYVYAKPSSFVAGVGVILSPLPRLLPRQPSERDGLTGPFKGEGGDRRHYVALTDQLKQSFAQMVAGERGNLLRIPLEEVMEGKVYSGVEAVQLGLVDAIGGGADAIQKAASLASVPRYGLVDINAEVARIFNQKLKRINEPLVESGLLPSLAEQRLLADEQSLGQGTGGSGSVLVGADLGVLRYLPFPGGIGEDPLSALPNFPMNINGPNVYYLYVGPSP